MSGKGLNIPKEKLIEFVPGYGKGQCATDIYRKLKAAGWTVLVRPGRRRRNERAWNPDNGRVKALSDRLSNMRRVRSELRTHKSGSRTKYFSRE